MQQFFDEQLLDKTKSQKNRLLIIYNTFLWAYIAISLVFLYYFCQLPHASYGNTQHKINILKAIHYPLTVLIVIFSFIFLGIKYKRVNAFYKRCVYMQQGLKETSFGSFIEYNEQIQFKDGVDFKSLVFLEWNKYKKHFYERKVLIFNEQDFPKIPFNANVTYVTQGNVLYSYEILS